MEVSMLPNEGSKVEKPDERLIKATPPGGTGLGDGDASDQQDCYMFEIRGSTGSHYKTYIWSLVLGGGHCLIIYFSGLARKLVNHLMV